MRTIKAYFDGKVFVPDEPVDLPTDRPLILHVEPSAERRDFKAWLGLALGEPENPNPHFKSDDELWKKG